MSIKTIEIICIPCSRCASLIEMIGAAVRLVEKKYKTKIDYEFKFTKNLRGADKYSVNASKKPLLIINGHTEGAGNMKADAVNAKILQIHCE